MRFQKVGIPRALLYYQYFPMWKTFFEELGAEVVVSSPTTKAMLAAGSARVVAETCLPTKVYCGHVLELVDKVDCLFIPSIRSIEPGVHNCSKFLGLPDLVRGAIPESPPVLDIDVDVNKGERAVRGEIYRLGHYFTRNPFKVRRALKRALAADREYWSKLHSGLTPPETLLDYLGPTEEAHRKEPAQALSPLTDGGMKVAVIGHPYNIYDEYINHGLLDKLRALGVEVLSTECVSPSALDKGTAKLIGKPYWTYEDEVVGAAGHYLDEEIDGLLCMVSFGCGPDSLMMDIIQRAAKHAGRVPLVIITIDEHTSGVGLVTRLEAFVDMLVRRRQRRGADEVAR